jgi:hypothetical protein
MPLANEEARPCINFGCPDTLLHQGLKDMRNRNTETQRNRGTERRKNRETEVTKETEDFPPLAARVSTLQEAVDLSLKDGLHENCLFNFSRALRAFEIIHNRLLPTEEVGSAFSLWWAAAKEKALLPNSSDLDEWRFAFDAAFAKARVPLGGNPLEEATRRADSDPPPLQAARYASAGLKRLIGVCWQLQRLVGDAPFFLSVREAARILASTNLTSASAMLFGLVHDGILTEVERGTPGGGRATRFRFNAPEFSARRPGAP